MFERWFAKVAAGSMLRTCPTIVLAFFVRIRSASYRYSWYTRFPVTRQPSLSASAAYRLLQL